MAVHAVPTAIPRVAVARPRWSPRVGNRLWLLGCLLLTGALRAPFLSWPLGIDEGGTAYIAQRWHAFGSSLYGSMWLDRPPLLVGLYRIAVLDGVTGVRVLGLVAALGIVTAAFGLGRELGGDRAGRVASVLVAIFMGSALLDAIFTPGELLAAGPAALSVLCLLRSRRYLGRREAGWLAGAGALAVTAALVKQSFFDAGAAGGVYVALRCVQTRRPIPFAAYAAGAAVPLLGVWIWSVLAGVDLAQLVYALFGFRLDSIRVLADATLPLTTRIRRLDPAVIGSGLVFAIPLALLGLARLRADARLTAALTVWLAAAGFGVLGGGSYWFHYLLQLVVPVSVLAGVALGRGRRVAVLTTAVVGLVLLSCVASDAVVIQKHVKLRPDLQAAAYIRTHARPGDTQYALYARADALYYAGLPTPFPYDWSLMIRTLPQARVQLRRLLGSPARPTWILRWQRTNTWRLDPDHSLAALLHREYRVVAHFDGKPVLLRRELTRP